MSSLIVKVEEFVKADLAGNDDSHSFAHANRVRTTALKIQEHMDEDVDILVVEIGALVHDVGDPKYSHSDTAGPDKVRQFLETLGGLTSEQINKIVLIVENIGFSKTLDSDSGHSRVMFPELAVVQDADRLDALGAMGIARCLMFSAAHGTPLFDPTKMPKMGMTKEEYRKMTKDSTGTAINHFFEKLFTLKDNMNTDQGRDIAKFRHGVMVQYVSELFNEWGTEEQMIEWFMLLNGFRN